MLTDDGKIVFLPRRRQYVAGQTTGSARTWGTGWSSSFGATERAPPTGRYSRTGAKQLRPSRTTWAPLQLFRTGSLMTIRKLLGNVAVSVGNTHLRRWYILVHWPPWAHLKSLGTPVVLSDGDVVFQPRKIQHSGIWDAVAGPPS